jgi:hypothetical protein
MAIALASLVKRLNNKDNRKQLIYCCNSRSVQEDVCTLFYNAGIGFGYAYINSRKDDNNIPNTVKVVNNFSCKNENDRVAIICSPIVASKLLYDDMKYCKKNNKESSYYLFLDEPTINADIEGDKFLRDNMEVIKYSPKWTILTSATNPDLEMLGPIISDFQSKYDNCIIDTIYSNEIFIGCEVKTDKNDYVMPHLGAKTGEELKNRIDVINKVPFLGRLYTHKVVVKLWNSIKPFVNDIPDINIIFSDVDNLKMDKIRQVALELLNKLSECSNNIITSVCSTNITDEIVEKVIINKNDDDFNFEDEKEIKENEVNNVGVNCNLLGTYHAYKYMNTNLIFTEDPVTFALTSFADLLDKLKENKIDSASKLFEKYEKLLDIHKKNVDRLITRTKNQDKQSQEIQELENNRSPSIDFPLWAQINTIDHIKEFAKTHVREIDPKNVRPKYHLESIPRNSVTTDKLMILLMCGVGVYTQSIRFVDKIYLDHVMNMATSGQLTYIISDSSLSYGANYPINRVFIIDDFANAHSIDTLFQSLSRAGRVGRSWMAEGYIPDSVAKTILHYSQNKGYGVIEAKNMVSMYLQLLKEDSDKLLDIKKKEEEFTKIMEYAKIIVPVSSVIPNGKDNKKEAFKLDYKPQLFNKDSKNKSDKTEWRPNNHRNLPVKNEEPKRYIPPHLRSKLDNIREENNKPIHKESNIKESNNKEQGWTQVKSNWRK